MPYEARRNVPHPSPRAHRHARGAVLLFSVYVITLAFFLLGGVFLQRTNIEMLSVQQMRNMQQAFYLAEGALDQALVDVTQESPPAEGILQTVLDSSASNASYTLTTPDAVGNPTVKTVRAVGTVGTLPSQTITATFRVNGTPYPQEGLWANRLRLGKYNSDYQGVPDPTFPKIVGTIRSPLGVAGAVRLYQVTVDGPVSVGPSQSLVVDGTTYPGYSSLYLPGVLSFDPAALGAGIYTWPGLITQLTQTPQQHPLPLPQRIDSDNDPRVDPAIRPNQCQPNGIPRAGIHVTNGNLFLKASQRLTVNDGDPLLDLDPNPERILVCLQTLVLDGHSKLIFTVPATIYLAGYVDPLNAGPYAGLLDRFDAGLAISNSYTFAQNRRTTLQAVAGTGVGARVYNNGIELVVPTWADRKPSSRTGMLFEGGTFHGSIAAPEAFVQMLAGETVNPVRIVADSIYYAGTSHETPTITRSSDLVLKQSPGDGTPNPQLSGGARPTVLSWTNASSSSSP